MEDDGAGQRRILNTASGIALDMCQAGHAASKATLGKITIDPGIALRVFMDGGKSGRFLNAQHFTGMSLEDAVRKAKSEFESPCGRL